MQTFFNPTTPFFDGEGKPLAGARVSFLDLETSASYISLTDSEGAALPNPIFTGSDGRLRLENGSGSVTVPCIADGMSYKVVVEKRTGVEPVVVGGILQNPGELYEAPYIAFVVTAAGNGGEGTNSTVLDSIAAVRIADKSLGSVICSGYYSAGDCPARVFTWVDTENPQSDNGISVLRNPEDATGYWKMSDPDAGTWDVRMAGLSTTNTAASNSTRLQALVDFLSSGATASRIYIPSGTFSLSGGFTCHSTVVFGRGGKLSMAGNNSKTLNLYGGVESYSTSDPTQRAIFATPDSGALTIRCGQGAFRSSWIRGATIASLKVSDTLVVDSDNSNYTDTGALVKMDELNDQTTFKDKVAAGRVKLGADWNIEPDDTAEVTSNRELKVSKGVTLLAKFKASMIEFFTKVKMGFGFVVDADNAWQSYDNSRSDWNGLMVLLAKRIFASIARVEEVSAGTVGVNQIDIKAGVVHKSICYDSDFVAQVGNGAIHFWGENPASSMAYTDGNIMAWAIHHYFDNVDGDGIPGIIHVLIDEHSSTKYLLFPNREMDGCAFLIYNPLKNPIALQEVDESDPSTVLGFVKVLGLFNGPTGLASAENIPTRIYVRNPTAAERTRFNIPATVHWIVDPFTM